MVRPKKHLGQHFLIDKNIARKITLCLNEDNPVICELGPGTGVLTEFLLERSNLTSLKLVEIDSESVEYLQTNFSDSRLNIFERDFLKMNLTEISVQPFALIGNFPYNISSQIFFKVLENRNLVPEVVGMIQKEVAERIAAGPGSKTYGILSVLLQAWYTIEYCFTVPEHVFNPPPKVKSAVIKLQRNNVEQLDCNEQLFFKVVKTAFGQRRKTLRNALKPLTAGIILQHALFDKRAEQLSVADFVQLTQYIESQEA
ncbi:MAG: 16S rRNA (adenine(1518)-N(6)/adenine(1519)-N(6))-dimethyltransferase RsmA [Bacteroidales bacterium]|nr:16S rRNA (adenine(1518)-N(6)/adenine(1519)-N(6))-dimethyltransferase RsmA [Bacteroidales bacterium]